MPPRSTATALVRAALAGAVALLLVLPTAVGADDAPSVAGPTTTTVDPPTTLPPTTLPPTTSTVADGPGAEGGATVTAVDEASYRDALDALSTAPSGPNTLVLAADIVVDDGTDPTYTGTADLVVEGGGHTLDGAGVGRLLAVDSPAGTDVTFRQVTLTGGRTSGDGGAVVGADGVRLAFEQATLSGNRAGGDGGAVATSGQLGMEDTTVEGNAAPDGAGGGASAADAVGLTRVTFAGNRARTGGALSSTGDAGLIDATVTANVATARGGGLHVGHRLYLVYGTIVANAAPVAANLDLVRRPSVLGTVLADPAGGGTNCDPTLPFRATDSFSDDTSCGGTAAGWAGTEGDDPLLGPLADNGGLTRTMLPAPESPLVDVIDPLPFWAGPMFSCTTFDDQRGVTRPQDGNGVPETGGATYGPYGPATEWCDIGAVEREAPPAPPAGPTPVAPRFTG